jgi:indolepyruvate ferredoxin oxidoreductase, beta subunit
MRKTTKILVAGVGGQGVVFLTNLIVESALQAEISVATSEIHGLSQRGGSVTAGITIGEDVYGFIEKAGVDILIGLEPLEAQRCVSYLYKDSLTIIDDNKMLPYSVNSGQMAYPKTEEFVNYLEHNIRKVIFITEELKGVKSIQRNLYVLGKLCAMNEFPIQSEFVELAIKKMARPGFEESSLKAFRMGVETIDITVE